MNNENRIARLERLLLVLVRVLLGRGKQYDAFTAIEKELENAG